MVIISTQIMPSEARSTFSPESSSIVCAISALRSLSSARRILMPANVERISQFPSAVVRVMVCSGAIRCSTVMVTLVPWPRLLSTSILPCMSSISFLTIGMPRPVPAILLSVLFCSLENSSNICGRNSLDIPIPVSSITTLYSA